VLVAFNLVYQQICITVAVDIAFGTVGMLGILLLVLDHPLTRVEVREAVLIGTLDLPRCHVGEMRVLLKQELNEAELTSRAAERGSSERQVAEEIEIGERRLDEVEVLK
jgi:hypothetical protein